MTPVNMKLIRRLLAGKIGEAEKNQDKAKVKEYMTALKEFNDLMTSLNSF